jgi:hypothetical protein
MTLRPRTLGLVFAALVVAAVAGGFLYFLLGGALRAGLTGLVSDKPERDDALRTAGIVTVRDRGVLEFRVVLGRDR